MMQRVEMDIGNNCAEIICFIYFRAPEMLCEDICIDPLLSFVGVTVGKEKIFESSCDQLMNSSRSCLDLFYFFFIENTVIFTFDGYKEMKVVWK